MDIGTETRVAEIATRHPEAIKVFQRRGVDFCCGGRRALAEVCEEKGLSFAEIRREIEAAFTVERGASPDWNDASLTELAEHIVTRYHDPLREELPRLGEMADKVARVHGQNHPEMQEVAETFRGLVEELGPHMMKEERILFPYLARLEGMHAAGESLPASPFGTVLNPIRMMEYEHESAGRALARMRELTRDYAPPEDACNTFRWLLHGLAELERELHEHIHLENNVLFPRDVSLEAELEGKAPSAV